MGNSRWRKRRGGVTHSKTALRRGIPLKSLAKRSAKQKGRICEIYPAVPDDLDKILFDVSNDSLFPDREKPS